MVQNVVLVFLRRRLSQRPNVEELESRNILKREFSHSRSIFSKLLYSIRKYIYLDSSLMEKTENRAGWCMNNSTDRPVWYIIQERRAHECTFLLFNCTTC